jgi:Uma2 family endonuclease
MTAAEYLEWERAQTERHEFLNGDVFRVAGGTRRHSLIGENLKAELRSSLRSNDCEVHGSDMRVLVEATGLYSYPDGLVSCPPFENEPADVLTNPVLLIEVLSPSTEDYDRGRKFAHYRQIPSLREYLVVSQDEAKIEQHQRTENNLWLLREVTGIDQTLHLTSLNLDLALSDVYAKVTFA